MPSIRSRRRVLSLCGTALGLAAAGCLGDAPDETDSSDGPPETGTTAARTAESTTADRTAIPASVVSDADAKERALAAEKAYLTERLRAASCLSDWGTTPTTASKRATVADRTAAGVRVELTHPYWYSTDRTEADGASEALYVVTEDDVRRIRGDDVSPC